MQRGLRTVAMWLFLGMLVMTGRLLSETKPAAETPPTRIALVNLAEVFKGYDKVKDFSAANQKMLEPYKEKAKSIQADIEQLKLRRRELEDIQNEAKTLFAKKNEAQMLEIYKEVMAAGERYARKHDIDLVMHYNDVPPDKPDFFNAANVSRKIQAGATVPMYIGPKLEITKAITAELNEKYRRDKKAAKTDGD